MEKNKNMFIVVWLIGVFVVAFLITEVYYRYIQRCKQQQRERIDAKIADKLIEHDIGNLKIESIDFVAKGALQMRGSWRLAQGNILTYITFKRLRDEEYKKML